MKYLLWIFVLPLRVAGGLLGIMALAALFIVTPLMCGFSRVVNKAELKLSRWIDFWWGR